MNTQNLPFLLASAGLIVLVATIGIFAVHVLGRRLLKLTQSLERIAPGRQQQLITLLNLGQWLLDILLVVSALLMLLSTFGINITPLLASAGVAGLAISLGAQTLIKDLLGGILILSENQFAVGDLIEVGPASGQVEAVTLRTTQVRATSGELYTIPNGEVRILANKTKGWSAALVDLGIAYEEDLERALDILQTSANAFAAEPDLSPSLLDAPQVLGPMNLGDSAITVRVLVKTAPGKHLETARRLRKWLLDTCEREHIDLPYRRQEVWLHTIESAAAAPVPTARSG
jgi:small-conductance mechanosensitive channel